VTILATQLAVVTKLPLDVAAHQRFVSSSEAGAEVLFLGVVRANAAGREVVELEYEAHPSAEDVLGRIVAEFAASPDVIALAVSHRSGRLAVGELALVAAVAAQHRREAFGACAALVDEVKRRLPIWKRQVFADGTDEWVNCP
jgi:molybdopterin synthase catalytic subunit